MKQNCLERQPAIVDLKNGKFQFIYNQIEVVKQNPDGTSFTSYDYDYVEVDANDEDVIISTLIHNQFTLDDEIALINNYLAGGQQAIDEFNDYQSFRASIKTLVKTTLQNDPLQ